MSFERLLAVQGHDTAADQLRHRRKTLPGLERLAEIDRRLASIASELGGVGVSRDAVAVRQRSFETELASVEAKCTGLEERMYSGTVTVARELQAMEAEQAALKRRASSLEDEALAAMTEREPLDASIIRLVAEQSALEAECVEVRSVVDAAQQSIDTELAANDAERRDLAHGVPDQLLGLYEKLRARFGGVGVASLVNRRCGGCHLDLSPSEIDDMRRRPPDEVVLCESCGRILVRPA